MNRTVKTLRKSALIAVSALIVGHFGAATGLAKASQGSKVQRPAVIQLEDGTFPCNRC
jgi:hypothetical protein